MLSYPSGLDCLWLAADSAGNVAAFITAGKGPIPPKGLENPKLMDLEQIALGLPKISQAKLLTKVPRPMSFVELAERGLFVYDWTDIHRTAVAKLHFYELVARPSTPLASESLPTDVYESVCKVEGIGTPLLRPGADWIAG